MKRVTIFGFLVLFILIVLIAFDNSFAKEYEVSNDTIYTLPHQICIDPGHGGPGASKYGANGLRKKVLDKPEYHP